MRSKQIYRAILCSFLFSLMAVAPHRATAKTQKLTTAQQKLVNYCVSAMNRWNGYYEKYTFPSQRLLAKMSRRELREKLEPCLTILKPKRYDSNHAFAVAYVLALRGIDIRENFNLMVHSKGVAEDTFPLMENVYRRSPSDFILESILNQESDGAGTETKMGTCFQLFRDYPTAFLRVSRNPKDLKFLFKSIRETEDVRSRRLFLKHLRRLSHYRSRTIAANARYCLKHYPKRNPYARD